MNALTSVQLLKSWRFNYRHPLALLLAVFSMLTGMNAFSQSTITTITDNNNGKGGYKNGNTFTTARFKNPLGIALDPSGTTLFMADNANNSIRMITTVGNKSSSLTYSVYTNKDGINHPVALAIDVNTNIYVLNQGTGKNGTLLQFDGYYLFNYQIKYLRHTYATNLVNATSITLDSLENMYVTVQSNRVIRITQSGVISTIGIITNSKTSLRGIVYMPDGNLYITDAGNNGIWKMNSTNGIAVQFTGFNGANDSLGASGLGPICAAFNHPENIAKAGNGDMLVADYNNAKVKIVHADGSVNLLYGVAPKYWTKPYAGWRDGTVNMGETVVTVQARQPYGLAVGPDASVYVTETYYSLLRAATGTGLTPPPPMPPLPPIITSITTNFGQITLTWTISAGATNYNVKRSLSSGSNYVTIASTTSTSFTDTNVSVGTVYFYVVSASNAGGEGLNSGEVSATPLPLPAPIISNVVTNLGDVALTWSPIVTATNYNVKRSNVSGGGYSLIGSTTNTTYTDANVTDGKTYYYVVSAVNGSGESANSTEVGATPLFPPAPVFLTVTTNFTQIGLTWSVVPGAIGYNLYNSQTSGGTYTIVASVSGTTYIDSNVVNGTTYYYVVTAVNPGGESTNSAEISVTQPIAPVPSPQIGYVTFPPPLFTSLFHIGTVSGTTFNNDTPIVIIGASGSQTFYTYSNTPAVATIPDPTGASASAPVGYQDGQISLSGLTVAQPLPNLAIKAIGEQTNHSSSAVVSALFQFVTANPQINGTNIYDFTINEITTNAILYYTVDGSDPTASSPNLNTIASLSNNVWVVSYNDSITTNVLFKVLATRNNYQASAIVSNLFLKSSSPANSVDFGFASGPGSSQFVASPGQSFVLPVALNLLPNAPAIYGLQFNLTVTNLGPNAVAPGAVDFDSLIGKPDQANDGYFEPIEPYYFISTSQPNNDPNAVLLPGGWYQSSQFINTNGENLLGIGWWEVYGRTNLYNTLGQNLLTYPIIDGTDPYPASQVVVGGYSFGIPTNATAADIYQIQIARQSATTFTGVGVGYGIPVIIDAPADTNLVGPGSINALKNVTIGQIKYLVGDVVPANWFNAGDFGYGDLIKNGNSDVIKVFDFAAYPIATPPVKSDLFDAMDSCGNIGVLDAVNGYYTNTSIYPLTTNFPITNYSYDYDTNGTLVSSNAYSGTYTTTIYLTTYSVNVPYYTTNIFEATPPALPTNNVTQKSYVANITPPVSDLFSGNDTNIDQIAFGDGVLDVCDVYVTFRRSEDPSRLWFERYWTNGVRVADTGIPNQVKLATKLSTANVLQSSVRSHITPPPPQVVFTAGNVQGSAGQTVQVPITATIQGIYPVRVLMLNLEVVPMGNSQALTSAVSFAPSADIGAPNKNCVETRDFGNYAAAWLDSTILGLPAAAPNPDAVGILSVTIPANAASGATYGIFFDHASASPNGLASFPNQTVTGSITVK